MGNRATRRPLVFLATITVTYCPNATHRPPLSPAGWGEGDRRSGTPPLPHLTQGVPDTRQRAQRCVSAYLRSAGLRRLTLSSRALFNHGSSFSLDLPCVPQPGSALIFGPKDLSRIARILRFAVVEGFRVSGKLTEIIRIETKSRETGAPAHPLVAFLPFDWTEIASCVTNEVILEIETW